MRDKVYLLLQAIFALFPIVKNKIFFTSYYGSQYGCNPKYLSEYMMKNHKDWDIVWAFVQPASHVVPGVRKVKYMSLRYFYELSTSKVFVTNYRTTTWYRKRKGQIYIQTWHSSLRLKMIEGDALQTLPAHYLDMAKHDSPQIDYLLSGCEFSTSIFKRAFWYNGEIVTTGTPREDLMFSKDKELKAKILGKLGISKDENVLLYAPTFRKDNSLRYYDIDYNALINECQNKWGGEWIVLLRLHPHLRDFSKYLVGNNTKMIDTTSYDDIQELLFVSNVVISDYSSLIFDFALTGRPCLLYAPDLDEYISKDRNFYFTINQLPFPLATNNNELMERVSNFDKAEYRKSLKIFMDSVGSYETGHSCQNVVNLFMKSVN